MKTPQSPAPVAGDEPARPASEQPVEAIGAGREEIDLYDDKVQEGIAWTMRQWGEALGLETWTQGDGSESVEGDVGAEIHTILVDAGLRDPETNEMAALSPASPARTPMGGPQDFRASLEASIRRAGGLTVLCRTTESRKKLIDLVCNEAAALAAPTPMGGEAMRTHFKAMQGMATAYLVPEDYRDRNGDVVYQGDNYSSESYKYDQAGKRAKAFANDMIYMLDGPEERSALAALTPMGGEVEALREALRKVDALARSGAAMSAADYSISAERLGEEIYKITTPVLAASSPSPAQGGEFDTLEEWEHDDQRELSRLYRHRFDDSLQFNRGQMRTAIRHGRRIAALSASPQPEAGEPAIRILCETTNEGVIGTTSLNVVRVEREDDGSFTAVTDHWPVSPSAQPAEDKLRDAISLILPLAKGYAAAHPVGSNQAYVDYVESFVSNEGDAISRPAAPSGGEKRAAIMREVKSYAACDDVGSAQWINALTSRLVEVTK